MEIKPIAHIYNDFSDKFGVPRQSGITDELISEIIFEPEYRDCNALRGMEDFSHLWLIWHFSLSKKHEKWSPTVRPPRLGGNKRIGVFATRSPNRPNPLGLSAVKIQKIDLSCDNGPKIYVSGADIVSGTPIFDIKPYIPFSDCKNEAVGGFTKETSKYFLNVEISDDLLKNFPKDKQNTLIKILENDPRPAYQDDPQRIYKFDFADYNISFRVENDVLYVLKIKKN